MCIFSWLTINDIHLFSVSPRYLEDSLQEDELDAWDRSEEDCRKDEWSIRSRTQGKFRKLSLSSKFPVYIYLKCVSSSSVGSMELVACFFYHFLCYLLFFQSFSNNIKIFLAV